MTFAKPHNAPPEELLVHPREAPEAIAEQEGLPLDLIQMVVTVVGMRDAPHVFRALHYVNNPTKELARKVCDGLLVLRSQLNRSAGSWESLLHIGDQYGIDRTDPVVGNLIQDNDYPGFYDLVMGRLN